MEENKKKAQPLFIKILGWLISLSAFAIGFYHTHLGLKSLALLHSSIGSYIMSGLILMLLVISYYSFVNGNKKGLYIYIFCATFYFVFNLTSFYPTYAGRTLVKEEAIALNKTLQRNANAINLPKQALVQSKVADLLSLKTRIIQQIKGFSNGGFGPQTKRYIQDFNRITNSDIATNAKLGSNSYEREQIADEYRILLDKAIETYFFKNTTSGDKTAISLYEAKFNIDTLKQKYTPILKEIIADDSDFIYEINKKSDILQLPKCNEQAKNMQNLATALDNETAKVNQAKGKVVIKSIGTIKATKIGTFEHALSFVKERFWKIDTLMMVALCLLIDFVVPLAIYFLIRKNDDEEEIKKPISGKF